VRALGQKGVFKVPEYGRKEMVEWLLGDNHHWISAGGDSMRALLFSPE
jgi:hypothetical protein